MSKKWPIIISILLLISVFSIAQTNPANPRRDWFVGSYNGTLKDSIPNITINCNMNDYYATDSTIFIPIGGLTAVVCLDSSLGNDRFCTNWPFNQYQYGKLHADSSVIFCNFSMGGCACTYMGNFCDPGHLMIFRGKKTSDTPLSVQDNKLENNSVVMFPNPAQRHVNIMSVLEIDNFELYDLLGKSIAILVRKTNNGYLIDFPPNIYEGLYFLRLKKDNISVTKKVMIKE